MTRLRIPEQVVDLKPCEQPGYWMGHLKIDDTEYRIEAYDPDSPDETVQQLVTELETLAECGDALTLHQLPDGSEVYLAVMPKG